MKLSHSSYGKYVTCPRAFKYHYLDKIRPIANPSSLIFGSAVDAALNSIVMGTNDELKVLETGLKKLAAPDVEFHKNDYDPELLDEATMSELQEKCDKIAGQKLELETLIPILIDRPVDGLSQKQRQVLAACCIASLKVKGQLMLEAYKRVVMPHIKRVVSSQEFINWKDEKGNQFTGVLDLVVDLDGHGEIPADNKTASRPYELDAVSKSTQLAIYSKVTGKTKAAFFVMDKTIKKNRIKICQTCGFNGSGGRHKTCSNEVDGKRCEGEWIETIQPEANIQIIVDDVPEKVQQITMEALSETAEAIKTGIFPRNLNACDNQYGRPCPYREFCWRGDKAGLKKA